VGIIFLKESIKASDLAVYIKVIAPVKKITKINTMERYTLPKP
jgi:hypothetical protein